MNIEGRDASYAETMERVARLLAEEKVNNERIASMSQEAAREFLNEAIISISKSLGIAVAKTAALVADVLEMGHNAVRAFGSAYNEGYKNARRIKPYEG